MADNFVKGEWEDVPLSSGKIITVDGFMDAIAMSSDQPIVKSGPSQYKRALSGKSFIDMYRSGAVEGPSAVLSWEATNSENKDALVKIGDDSYYSPRLMLLDLGHGLKEIYGVNVLIEVMQEKIGPLDAGLLLFIVAKAGSGKGYALDVIEREFGISNAVIISDVRSESELLHAGCKREILLISSPEIKGRANFKSIGVDSMESLPGKISGRSEFAGIKVCSIENDYTPNFKKSVIKAFRGILWRAKQTMTI